MEEVYCITCRKIMFCICETGAICLSCGVIYDLEQIAFSSREMERTWDLYNERNGW